MYCDFQLLANLINFFFLFLCDIIKTNIKIKLQSSIKNETTKKTTKKTVPIVSKTSILNSNQTGSSDEDVE